LYIMSINYSSETTPIGIDVIAALVEMSPRNQTSLAHTISTSQPTLSSALKGARRLPPEKVARLLRELYVEPDGRLDTGRVHLWVLGLRLDALRLAVRQFFPSGAMYAGLWRSEPLAIERLRDVPLIAIFDHENTRVIARSDSLGLFATPEPVSAATVPGLTARLRGTGRRVDMIDIPSADFRRWERADITCEEYDAVLRGALR
jgi:hypothetical protein